MSEASLIAAGGSATATRLGFGPGGHIIFPLLGNFPSLSATLGITRIAPVAFHINVNSS
jgi:hypothetical protein